MMRPLVIIAALFIIVSISQPALGTEAGSDCLKCHEIGSAQSSRHIKGADFKTSVHGSDLSCLDCHPAAEDEAHQKSKTVTPVNCLECHEPRAAHGNITEQAPQCHQCHGRHFILPRTNVTSTLSGRNLAATCSACHAEEAGGGIRASLLSFRLKGHGKADLTKDYSRANCLDCHQGRAAHNEKEPITDAACYKCHDSEMGGQAVLGSFHGTGLSDGLSGDILYLVTLWAALAVFCWGWGRKLVFWRQGKPEFRLDRLGERFSGLLKHVFGQRKVFTRPAAGWSHYALFAGFLLPFVAATVTQFRFNLPGFTSGIISLMLDLAGIALLAGVTLAVFRRIYRPEEFQNEDWTTAAALLLLSFIAITGFLAEGTRLAAAGAPAWTAPAGSLAALIVPDSALASGIIQRLHLIFVLVFLALTPFTRLQHLVTAPLNIFFRKLEPGGRLEPINLDNGDQYGLSAAKDLTWKDRLDLDACVSCGRCRDVCPAHASEKPLSPMQIINTLRQASVSSNGNRFNEAVPDDDIWACTTCRACVDVCPVMVEQTDKLVGLRRSLVMNDGRMPAEAARLLRRLEIYGDPAGMGKSLRSIIAKSMSSTPESERKPLFLWLGCQGYFHPRGKDVASGLVKLVERAGRTTRILGGDEICCGDPARRLGGEDVFQNLARKNIERLKELGVKQILACCPHCFNTLKNEYSDFGADFEVLTPVQWLYEQIQNGRLKVARPWPHSVVYHDPCYVGRINGLTEEPRRILKAVPGLEIIEPDPSGRNTFCCGAGGGRMWLHEEGLRINQVRAGQCRETGAEQAAVSCPYCLVMLEDGLADTGMPTFDIIEILEWVTR